MNSTHMASTTIMASTTTITIIISVVIIIISISSIGRHGVQVQAQLVGKSKPKHVRRSGRWTAASGRTLNTSPNR